MHSLGVEAEIRFSAYAYLLESPRSLNTALHTEFSSSDCGLSFNKYEGVDQLDSSIPNEGKRDLYEVQQCLLIHFLGHFNT